MGIEMTKKIDYFQVFFLLFFIFMLRPSFLGQAYSAWGLLGLFVLTGTIFFLKQKVVGDVQEVYFLSFSIVIFWIYCLVISVFIGDSDFEVLLKSVIAGAGTSIILALHLSDRRINAVFFKYFSLLNSFLGWSIGVTVALLIVFSADVLRVGNIDIKGYSDTMIYSSSQLEEFSAGNGEVLFPFSPVYGVLTEYGIYRFLGLYRESGIAQLFFVFSAIYYLFSKEKNRLCFLGCFIGAIFCSSTTVVFSVVAAVVCYVSGNRKLGVSKQLAFLLFLIILVVLVVFAPGLGILDKLTTHSASFDDRILAMSFAWQDFPGILIGNGLYPSYYLYENIGINAISYVYYFGLIGFLGYCFIFLVLPFFWLKKNGGGDIRRYITALSPLFITSLFFQPLVDAPLAYALLFYLPNNVD